MQTSQAIFQCIMFSTQHCLSHVGINQSVDNFIDFVILFSNKFLSKNDVVLHFHVDDLHVLKEIHSFLDNYFVKIGWNRLWSIVLSRQGVKTICRKYSISHVLTFFFLPFFTLRDGNICFSFRFLWVGLPCLWRFQIPILGTTFNFVLDPLRWIPQESNQCNLWGCTQAWQELQER